jgi:hypothetical protein
LQFPPIKISQPVIIGHQFASVTGPRPGQFRTGFIPVPGMLGDTVGASISDAAVATTDTGLFFNRFSQHFNGLSSAARSLKKGRAAFYKFLFF